MSKKLRAILASLASDFALDVIAALGRARFAELSAIEDASRNLAAASEIARNAPREFAARSTRVPQKPAAAAPRAERARPRAASDRGKKFRRKPEAAPSPPNPLVTHAAVAFFTERGRKGATSQQVTQHLTSMGLVPSGDLVAELAEGGAIRDAGFRRAAGNGNATAPVYVLTA